MRPHGDDWERSFRCWCGVVGVRKSCRRSLDLCVMVYRCNKHFYYHPAQCGGSHLLYIYMYLRACAGLSEREPTNLSRRNDSINWSYLCAYRWGCTHRIIPAHRAIRCRRAARRMTKLDKSALEVWCVSASNQTHHTTNRCHDVTNTRTNTLEVINAFMKTRRFVRRYSPPVRQQRRPCNNKWCVTRDWICRDRPEPLVLSPGRQTRRTSFIINSDANANAAAASFLYIRFRGTDLSAAAAADTFVCCDDATMKGRERVFQLCVTCVWDLWSIQNIFKSAYLLQNLRA